MVDQDKVMSYNGKEMALRDIPDRQVRNLCGLGHSEWDIEHNPRHPPARFNLAKWEFTAADCARADETKGIWDEAGEALVCPGCGLDFT